jgi:MoaA/NifB/PqqE/SkfB family radical SAM enzyme
MFKNNVMIFSITDYCNAHCKTCSFWKTENPVYLPKEEIQNVINKIYHNLDIRFLSVTGGETLTYPYLSQLINEAKNYGMIVQLMTNGSLLNKTKINQLAESGLNFIAFSIDHYDDKIVFENRGLPNLLQKIKENIVDSKEAGLITQGGITIAKYNINDLEDITYFALNELNIDEIYFSLPVNLTDSSYKLGNDDYDVIDLSDSQIIDAVKRMIALKKQLGNRISHRLDFLKDIEKFYAKEKQKYPCRAGEKIFYLDNHLNLYDCMVKNRPLGKITESVTRLKNIYCYDCPLQCFREGSVYLNGLKSLPLYIELIFNKNYWRIIRQKIKHFS